MIDSPAWAKDIPAEVAAINLHHANGEKEDQEVVVVSASETIIDPWTVMVAFGHAMTTEAAMF